MPAAPYKAYLNTARQLARTAAERIRRMSLAMSKVQVGYKSNGGIVTNIDVAIEDFLMTSLAEAYPAHGFFGEESGKRGDEQACWVIDPLDGTTNFVHQFPFCAISLAFYENAEAKVAVIHSIYDDLCYYAIDGGGAFCDDRRIRVSARSALAESLVISSGGFGEKSANVTKLLNAVSQFAGVRRTGSTCLDMAQLAAGLSDIALIENVQFWDVAAGALIIREAGGMVTHLGDETPLVFGEHLRSGLASNGHLHRAAQAIWNR